MTTTTQSINLISLMENDPVYKFLIDGGSWADAIEMEILENTLVLEAKLKAATKKQNPSAQRYCAKLLEELRSAYAYVGKGSEKADEFFQEALASHTAPKPKEKAKAEKKTTSQNAWDLLANDSDDE